MDTTILLLARARKWRYWLLAMALTAGPAYPQLVNDGATRTLTGVTNSIGGSVIVGTNGSFTLLVLADNALLTNSANGIIGRNASARSNEVHLLSPSARWRMGGSLFVGSNGVSSRLVVSNGALLENLNGNLGAGPDSDNNSALITGPGTLWTNRGSVAIAGAFIFGSSSNQLVVSDGAALVSDGTGSVGGFGNQVLITGVGSRWANQSDFTFGGTGNRLELSDGAQLICSNATISGLLSGDDNTVVLAGLGTAWTNRGDLTMGFSSTRGVLRARQGASLFVGGRASLGAIGGANFNSVSLSDPGSVWTVGADLYVGNGGSANSLAISNGAFVASSNAFVGGFLGASANSVLVDGAGSVWSNRHDLYIGDADIDNRLLSANGGTVLTGGDAVLGARSGANANSALVTDPGSRWLIGSDVHVGSNSSLNRLLITNGATVTTAHLFYLGSSAGANSNTVTVTGAGSALTNRDFFFLGQGGAGNQLIVSNGASARLGSGFAGIGLNSSASNNAAMVTDNNSFWGISGRLDVGRFGRNNQVTVANGGAVSNSEVTLIGFDSSGNQVLVTGTNSTWSSGDGLMVGYNGNGNRLVVNNGALFLAESNIVVGEFASSTNNRVLVDGATFLASNAAGTARLNVRRGTNVFNAGLMDVDQLVVTNKGTNAIFTGFGNGSSITIPSGSTASQYPSIINVSGLVGATAKVIVTLSNLTHTFPQDLDILLVNPAGQKVMLMSDCGGGDNISNVRLTFEDGQNNLPFVGPTATGTYRPTDFDPGETLPAPASAGPYSLSLSSFNGSSPNGSWRLFIADDANPDSGSLVGWALRIATDAGPNPDGGAFEFNGGTLITRGAIINNGAPFVVGTTGTTPAVWDVRAGVTNTFVSGSVLIGNQASFAQLIHTNSALLTNSSSATLGRQFGANSNSATLAGAGSRWLLADGIFVGNFGSGNRLAIRNGATIAAASSSVIGNELLSTDNEAVISGAGSTWFSSAGQFFVGNGGRNNRLLVSDGGQLFSSIGRIGDAFGDSTNNMALVTGAGSSWNNTSELLVGNVGARNQLVIGNGGTVFVGSAAYVGFTSTSTNNRVIVDGGTLRVTNASATGTLDVRRGTNVINSGLVEVDVLLVTNTLGRLELNGGTVSAKRSRLTVGQGLRVGNGVTPATYILNGNGSHVFETVVVSANGTLAGNGMVGGPPANSFAVLDGGTLSPGISIGKMVFTNNLLLFGKVFMEISRNGAALTNDQVLGPISYGGDLIVTNIGPTPLAAGDKFTLFIPAGANSFQSLTLPPLDSGLAWTNKLAVDGSLEVVGVPVPKIASVTRSGTNIVIAGTNGSPNAPYVVLTATNVSLPLSNWTSLATRQFGAAGEFSFTNAIALGERERYFRIRSP